MEQHIDELVSAYIDNELSIDELQTVNVHLKGCEQCKQLVEELYNIQSEARSIYQNIHVPEGFEKKVLEKITSKSSAISMVFSFGIAIIIIITALYFFGAFFIRVGSISMKILSCMIYTAIQLMGYQPLMRISVMLFAIILLVLSVIALRRLLHNNAEGDESFG